MSHNLDSRAIHLVVDLDVSLRRAHVLVPGKLHDHLGRDAAVGELGDKAAPPAWHLRLDGDAAGAVVIASNRYCPMYRKSEVSVPVRTRAHSEHRNVGSRG